MKFTVEQRIRSGYIAAFILLLLAFVLAFITEKKMVLQTNALNHTNTAINSLEFLVSATKDAETGVRGFLLVDDTVFLEPYKNASTTIDSLHGVLTTLIGSNPVQKKNLEEVTVMITEELNLLNQLIKHNTVNPNSFIEGDKAAAYRDKVLMEEIRSKIGIMQGIEEDIFKIRKEELERTSNTIEIINYISIILAIILGAYSIITFNKENIAKKKANANASRYHAELEKRVEELKHANEELVNLRSIEKFAATGRIARTIAHEVRNPLTNIALAAEQLKDEIGNNEDCVLLIDMINRNSSRINQLITDLLNSTRFVQLDFKNVSLNTLLDETIEFAKDRLDLNGIKIEKNYSKNMSDVSVDEQKLKIAFLNIIVNAIEAMEPNKGVLRIETEMNKNKCIVTIKDNGKGINEEEMARMFEPYYSSKSKGTGLGLTNTQNIILNHKGSIKVQSEIGVGTSFVIAFDPA